MTKLLIATHNPAKLNYYKVLLNNFDLELVSLKNLGINADIEENGKSEEDNALLKARFFASISGEICFSDDAGLYIDALNGEPGFMTRRWGGRFPDSVSDKEWLNYLLKRMKGVSKEKRTAHFKIARAVVIPGGKEYLIKSKRNFIILEKPNWKYYKKGWPTGMIAMPKGYNKPWSGLSTDERIEIDKKDINKLKIILNKIFKL